MTTPARRMTLATVLARNARIHDRRTAVVCGGTSLCYGDLDTESGRLAQVLRRQGVAEGSRVAVLHRNCHRFIKLLFAVTKIGAVLVPLNWRLAASELLYVLRDSGSTVLCHGGDFGSTIESLRAELQPAIEVVDLSRLEPVSGERGPAATDAAVGPNDDDVAVQMYTAAFEGHPRGAQITHGGYMAEAASVSLALALTEADAALVTVPLFHTFGLELAIAALARGGKCILADPFDARESSRIMEREGVSVLVCAGQHLVDLLGETERRQGAFSCLRVIMGSGASKEMRGMVRAVAPRARFMDAVYGQTECGAIVTGCDTDEAEAVGPGCVGRPLMLQDVRVFSEDDAELPPGEVGEIVVRGPRVMAGYYNSPKETEESLRKGWRHTGDLGMLDEGGYLHYVGRKRELIKSGMENVYPAEVEAVLSGHPSVAEVAVIGIPDVKWVEAVTAVVALKKGEAATAEDLIQFCRERLAGYKKPRYVRFVDELPRDSAGRVARQEIRDRYGGA